jgi:CheY-like chemotaxis protein
LAVSGDYTLSIPILPGKEAVQLHRELTPDVTLTDLQLPDMSGLDAISAIRSDGSLCRDIEYNPRR